MSQVPRARIDDAALRILSPLFQVGVFDRTDYGNASAKVDSAAHAAFAQTLAEAGTVLLKNDGILPLQLPRNSSNRGANVGTFATSAGVVRGSDERAGGARRHGEAANVVRDSGESADNAASEGAGEGRGPSGYTLAVLGDANNSLTVSVWFKHVMTPVDGIRKRLARRSCITESLPLLLNSR